MDINETFKFFQDNWIIILVIIVVITPVIWGIIGHLYENRVEEKESKIRMLEEKINNPGQSAALSEENFLTWKNISDTISKASNGEEFLTTLKGIKSPYVNLSGNWDMEASDVEVPERNIEYSLKLTYKGECEITQNLNFLTFIGNSEGIDSKKKYNSFHWNITGVGIINAEYIGGYYHLYPKTMAPTSGVLMLLIDRSGTKLNGFYVAKRALKGDQKGQEQGFGFGYFTLTKKEQ